MNPATPFNAEEQTRLLDELPDAVMILNSDLNIIWANQRAEEVFQSSLDVNIGHSVVSRVHPDDLELTLRSIESVMDKDIGNLIEVRGLVGSEWHLFEVRGRTINWLSQGAVLFTFRDITERRRFEVSRDDVARFRSMVQYSSAIVFLVSKSGLVHSVSGAITRNLGLDPEMVERRALRNIVAPDDWAILQRAMDQAGHGDYPSQSIVCCVRLRRHGSEEFVYYELSIVDLLDDATVNAILVTAHDVSARVAAESELQGTLHELRDTSSLLNATLEASADGILVVDVNRRITSFNREFVRMWRLGDSFAKLSNDQPWRSAVQNQVKNPEGFFARVDELYLTPEADGDDVVEFVDGRVFQQFSRPQYIDGAVVGRVWTFIDVTTQKNLESDLQSMAFYDDLTGLANRALFTDHVNQAIARIERNSKYVAVLYLDIDNFKTINDSLGHSVGDDLLRAVGAALGAVLRRADTAARLGGDEFAILIEDVEDRHEVLHLAKRILSVLREPFITGSHRVSTTASIGIAFATVDSTCEELLRNADLAMYRAKSQGKDRYEEFQDHMHAAMLAHLELETDLRKTLRDEQYVIHYQPIVDLSSRTLVAFEALVRWRHPTRGLLGPSVFITKAEELGIIGGINYFVLGEACRQFSHWIAEGLAPTNLFLSVNVSASEVADPFFADRVRDVLQIHQFDPSRLVLEITESSMMTNIRGAVINLRSLRDLGLRLAIDDFGTGYSSLTHLATLPIDILKIDRTFVNNDSSDEVRPEFVRAIVQLAETLTLRTIAEGVETEQQASYLLDIGCRWAQGYHLGRPTDAHATELLLREHLDSESP